MSEPIRQIVMPGELVSDRPERLDNTFWENNKTYSKILGIYDKDANMIIPLEGAWDPRTGDNVVGVVAGEKNHVYNIELGSFQRCILVTGKFDTFSFETGDVIQARIKDVENRRTVVLEEPKALQNGRLIGVKPTKVHRIIGRGSTMINMIAEKTKSNIVIGMNGLVWLRNGNIELATLAILKIENEAHVSGLTDRIKLMLEEKGN